MNAPSAPGFSRDADVRLASRFRLAVALFDSCAHTGLDCSTSWCRSAIKQMAHTQFPLLQGTFDAFRLNAPCGIQSRLYLMQLRLNRAFGVTPNGMTLHENEIIALAEAVVTRHVDWIGYLG